MNNNLTLLEIFAKKITALLEEHEMSQRELAKLAELSEGTIAKYLKCNVYPTIDALCRIADAFNVSTDFLLGRTIYKSPVMAAPAFAEELDLSPEAVSALTNDIKTFKEFSNNLSVDDTNKYLNKFFESNVLVKLMISGYLMALKNAQSFILESVPYSTMSGVDADTHKDILRTISDKFNENYLFYLKYHFNDISIDPEDIIKDLCNIFSFIPNDEKEKLLNAGSLTDIATILRNSKSEIVRNYFSNHLKVISLHSRGQFVEFLNEFSIGLPNFTNHNTAENEATTNEKTEVSYNDIHRN